MFPIGALIGAFAAFREVHPSQTRAGVVGDKWLLHVPGSSRAVIVSLSFGCGLFQALALGTRATATAAPMLVIAVICAFLTPLAYGKCVVFDEHAVEYMSGVHRRVRRLPWSEVTQVRVSGNAIVLRGADKHSKIAVPNLWIGWPTFASVALCNLPKDASMTEAARQVLTLRAKAVSD